MNNQDFIFSKTKPWTFVWHISREYVPFVKVRVLGTDASKIPEGGIFVMITVSTFIAQLINLVKGQR